ncbi:MAG: trimethylamine methyltransferase family protein, partial [Ilumatobacter sp.]
FANFETAFYRSTMADNSSYEQWLEDGSTTTADRANIAWKESLAAYEAPPLDDAIDAELLDFIGRRKSEMPDGIG